MSTVVLLAVLGGFSGAPPVPPQAEVLESLRTFAAERSGRITSAVAWEGRLQVFAEQAFCGADAAAESTAGLLSRLDRAFGAPPEPSAAALTGFLLRDRALYQELCAAAAASPGPDQTYLNSCRDQPGFVLYQPPLAVVLATPETTAYQAEHALLHAFGHLEAHRRFGLLPLWLREGLACAGEEGARGAVVANWHRQGESTPSRELDWRGATTSAVVLDPALDLTALYGYQAWNYDDRLARLAFAFVTYGLEQELPALHQFCQGLAELRVATWQGGGNSWEPPVPLVVELIEQSFGKDLPAKLQSWWEERYVRVASLPPLVDALSSFLTAHAKEIKKHSPDHDAAGVAIYYQGAGTTAHKSAKAGAAALQLYAQAFGELEPAPGAPAAATVVLLRDRELYQQLCQVLAAADPRFAPTVQAQAQEERLLLAEAQLVVLIDDVSKSGLPIENRAAHELAQLECRLRFGALPLWLTEGLACAAEDWATKSVRANWYRVEKGEAAAESWRQGRTSALVKSSAANLEALYAYEGRCYDSELARLAYAFAVYGLEQDGAGLQQLCRALVRETLRVEADGTGRIAPERIAALVAESFGPEFATSFQKFWAKPPGRSKSCNDSATARARAEAAAR